MYPLIFGNCMISTVLLCDAPFGMRLAYDKEALLNSIARDRNDIASDSNR
jgi:hypothetical protein